MVTTTQVTQAQYLTILKGDKEQQLKIIASVIDTALFRGRPLQFRLGSQNFSAVDVITANGYKGGGVTWADKLLSGELPPKVQRLLIAAVRAVGMYVDKYPLYAQGFSNSIVLYIPMHSKLVDVPQTITFKRSVQGRQMTFEKIQFYPLAVDGDMFLKHYSQTLQAMRLISKLFKANKSLLRAKVSRPNATLLARRGARMGQVWNDMTHFLNTLNEKPKNAGERKQLLALHIVLGQQEIDQYAAGVPVLVKLLNKVADTPELLRGLYPQMQELVKEWPYEGMTTRSNTLYLPIDAMDIAKIVSSKRYVQDALKTSYKNRKKDFAGADATLFKKAMKNLVAALSGTYPFEESLKLFYSGLSDLDRLKNKDAKNEVKRQLKAIGLRV